MRASGVGLSQRRVRSWTLRRALLLPAFVRLSMAFCVEYQKIVDCTCTASILHDSIVSTTQAQPAELSPQAHQNIV